MWRWCEKGEEIHAAKEIGRELLNASHHFLAQDHSSSAGKDLNKQAVKAHELKRLEAMVKLAATEPYMTVHITELDSDPWILGVSNGVVNLRTGRLQAPDPKYLITRQCGARYLPGSKCSSWLKFLNDVFNADKETIETIQRALGYTLTGSVTEEVLFICYGRGSNGKSVFNNIVATVMGAYGRVAPTGLLTMRREGDSSPRNDLASLAGARFVSINELQTGDRLDEQIVKLLAGREPIAARFLHKEFFEFQPVLKAWLRTNHKPIVTGDDDGIWRRLVVIPFLQQFSGAGKDPNLEDKLLAERDGILEWMLEGALKWQKDGLKLSPLVLREVAAYRNESDLLGQFLSDACAQDSNGKIEQSTLYTRYRDWSHENGLRPLAKASFTRRLAERGFEEARSNGKRFYAGITADRTKTM